MKSNQKTILILLGLSMMLIISVVNINTTTDQAQLKQDQENGIDEQDDTEEVNLGTQGEFINGSKTITAGQQEGVFNNESLKYDDGISDGTHPEILGTYIEKKGDATTAWTSGRSVSIPITMFITIEEALKYDDNKYLIAWSPNPADPTIAPGTNYLRWGEYSDPFPSNPDNYRGIFKIVVEFEFTVGERGRNLQFRVKSHNLGWSQAIQPSVSDPEPGVTYIVTIIIDNFTPYGIFDSIKNGNYIDMMQLKWDTPLNRKTKVYVDWANISYYFNQVDMDF